jgi:hypothetical protein
MVTKKGRANLLDPGSEIRVGDSGSGMEEIRSGPQHRPLHRFTWLVGLNWVTETTVACQVRTVSSDVITAGYHIFLYTCIMDQISIKTPNPKCRLHWCLVEFIDWRWYSYSQSCWYFRPFL